MPYEGRRGDYHAKEHVKVTVERWKILEGLLAASYILTESLATVNVYIATLP